MNLSRPQWLVLSILLGQPAWANMPTDRMIVKFKPDTASASGLAHAKRADPVRQISGAAMVPLHALANGAQVYQLPSSLDIASAEQLARKIAADPNVVYAEPDRIRKRALIPNDPFYANQWQLYDTYGARLTSAWDLTTGSSAVVIALVDTGYLAHTDLSERFLPGYDFISDGFIANDGDGRDADARDPGDWVTQAEIDANPSACKNTAPSPSSWHGLMVAGIAGATGNNAIGVAGMNWGARLLPVRALGKCGGFTSDIAEGMRWAAGLAVPGVPANSTPAQIVNVSLGSTDPCSATEQDAINAIVSAGKVVVTAAGNEQADASTHSPSNCANVIAVGATTRSGSRASYSNFGTGITVSAPVGEDLRDATYSTWNSGTTSPGAEVYGRGVGTSFAAPYVSGIIGLMLSVSPNLNPDQIKSIIQSTAQAFPSGGTCTTQICGAGIIDANAAVRAAAATVGTGAPGGASSGASGSSSSSSGGGGGGGCSTTPAAAVDPSLLILVAVALLGLARRTNSLRCASFDLTGTSSRFNIPCLRLS